MFDSRGINASMNLRIISIINKHIFHKVTSLNQQYGTTLQIWLVYSDIKRDKPANTYI